MKSMLAASLGLFALVGCSSPVEISTSPQSSVDYAIQSVEKVNWQEVSVPSRFALNINEASQRIETDTIQGPIGAFTFRASQVGVNIEITSPVKHLQVFAPNVAIYNQDLKLLKTYISEDFDYDRNDFITGEAMHGEVSFIVPVDVTNIYVVIYTTDADLERKTTLIHPAKAMAIAKRTDPPKVRDPVAKHVEFGVLNVKIDYFSVNNKVENLPVSKDRAFMERVPEASVIPETKRYYHSSIQKAVEANDIPKALSLLDEAKALGIEGAQEVFVKAVNAK